MTYLHPEGVAGAVDANLEKLAGPVLDGGGHFGFGLI